jgi:YHS domain-containing protein
MKTAAMGIAVPEVDPVCGMEVDRGKSETSGRTVSYHGQTYFFCSDDCRKRFDAAPASFVHESSGQQPTVAWAAPPLLTATALPRGEHDMGISQGGIPTAPKSRGMSRSVRPPGWLTAPETKVALPMPVEAVAGEPEPLPVLAPAAGGRKMSLDPTCGNPVDEEHAAAAGLKFAYKGRTYFFASQECRDLFEKQPELYADEETPPAPIMASAMASDVKDPVCGMAVDPKRAAQAGLKSDYKGQTYYFCSDDCKKKFDRKPEEYLKK